MMKKILIITAGIIFLVFLLFSGSFKQKYFSDRSDFNIPDTSKITSFTIIGADTLNFEKYESSWLVNNQYNVNPVAVNNFLFVFKNMAVKGLTMDVGIDEAFSLKLNIRCGKKSKRFRFYPVSSGSLMHYEGSSKYYQVEVKGAESIDLSKIISDDIMLWRDKLLFNYGINDIQSIKAKPYKAWGNGFEMYRKENAFLLKNQEGSLLDSSFYDANHLLMYAGYFEQVYFDSSFSISNDNEDIFESEPLFELSIESMNAENRLIRIYSLKDKDGQTDMFKAGCRIDHGDEIFVVPYVYLDPLMMSLEQFLVE